MRRFACVVLLSAGLLPVAAFAQTDSQGHLPITTGTTTQRMDAPETNNQLEQYEHSAMVQSLAHKLGLSPEKASQYFEDFNSGVVIAVILFFLLKIVPGKFRARRANLSREIVEARETSAEAERRLKAIEERLSRLGQDVDDLRKQSAESLKAEEVRMHAAMEEEKRRIIRAAEADIEAAGASAQRGLRQFAADLALERAAQKVQLSPENDRLLIDEFMQGLANDKSLRGRN